MADFDQALQKTLLFEGGYVDDPDDVGGETYKGIARRYHGTWDGWDIIDDMKEEYEHKRDFMEALEENEQLQDLVKSFYRQHFWERIWGDEIPDENVAEEVFDTAVNMGVRSAVRYLQESINLLNRNERNYPDIVEDGLFGTNTLSTLQSCLEAEQQNPKYVLKLMNLLQGMHYIESMRNRPVNEKYARGWLKRVTI